MAAPPSSEARRQRFSVRRWNKGTTAALKAQADPSSSDDDYEEVKSASRFKGKLKENVTVVTPIAQSSSPTTSTPKARRWSRFSLFRKRGNGISSDEDSESDGDSDGNDDAGADRHAVRVKYNRSASEMAPPEFTLAKTKNDEPIIPSPWLFESSPLILGADPKNVEGYMPSVAQCAVHLEILSCYDKLKEDVCGENGKAWARVYLGGAVEGDDDGEIRWKVVVELAVQRFWIWWGKVPEMIKALDEISSGEVKEGTYEEADKVNVFKFPKNIKYRRLPAAMLPPLDVLMVWHTFMLNPHSFYEDCIRLDRMDLWGMPFPWDAIHGAINASTWTFALSADASSFFQTLTGLTSDLLQSLVTHPLRENSAIAHLKPHVTQITPYDSLMKTRECPTCEKEYATPLSEWVKNKSELDFRGLCPSCGGNCDGEFTAIVGFLRAVRRVLQLLDDDQNIFESTELLLPGFTIHPRTGEYDPERFDTFEARESWEEYLASTFPQVYNVPNPNIPEIATRYYPTLSSITTLLSTTPPPAPHPPFPITATSTSNTTPFTPTPVSHLPQAIHRQDLFTHKMSQNQLWIRSPAVKSTLSNAIDRYRIFFGLIAETRGKMFVPTLDVDLVWHTMQMWPRSYWEYSVHRTVREGDGGVARYVDHNDRLEEGVLGDGFAETKRAWEEVEARMKAREALPTKNVAFAEAEKKKEKEKEREEDKSPNRFKFLNFLRPDERKKEVPEIGVGGGGAGGGEMDDGEGYDICLCWTCELRREMEMVEGMRVSKKRRKMRGSGCIVPGEGVGEEGVGMVVGPVGPVEKRALSRRKYWECKATVHYYKQVERARKEGGMLPVWSGWK
ncbi:hypothetical protein DFH27DRAFT_52645 [Peziza echinospora]|nr:hypothetical protein DFH27DRAFT_52645 [Peziza echinospora]